MAVKFKGEYDRPSFPRPGIEAMNEIEKPSRPLLADDSVIIKIPGNQNTYRNTKEFAGAYTESINCYFPADEIFRQGIKVELLEPGKNWVKGSIRLRLVFEFIPNELENSKTSGEYLSPLDDIRNINL